MKCGVLSVMALASHLAIAQPGMIDFLTCNISQAELLPGMEQLKPAGLREVSGNSVVSGPVQDQTLCIQNITISAAFGAFGVAAELCDATVEPLLDLLSKRASLQRVSVENHPGVIAGFTGKGDSFVIFNGAASFEVAPDPSSKKVAFLCARQLSGTQ